MKKLLHYWIRGWKFQLAMLVFNICFGIVLVPIALLTGIDKQSYYSIAIFLYVLFLIPIGGYLS